MNVLVHDPQKIIHHPLITQNTYTVVLVLYILFHLFIQYALTLLTVYEHRVGIMLLLYLTRTR